jgi:hypothetical protein
MTEPKTPRDWLLARHAPATPRLDNARNARRAALPAPDISWREFLGELLRPHRNVWRAFVLVWLGLLVFRLTLGHAPRPTFAHPPPPEAMAVWLAQLKSHETYAQIDRHP